MNGGRGERLFRLLLLLQPRHVRRDSGEELLELFRQHRNVRLRRTGGLGPGFWAAIVRDQLTSGWRERRDPRNPDGRPRRSVARGSGVVGGWLDDLRYAARRLRKSPGFSLVAVTILVLGIGVNATVFSVVNALLLQPPPFHEPERVVRVLQDSDGGIPSSTSYPAYQDITRTRGVFSDVSAFYTDEAFITQDDRLVHIVLEYATASYLDVIGLTPSRGVWFGPEHDDPAGPPAAVVTYRMWRDGLGADPSIVGSSLVVNGAAVTVVGVGPPHFNGGRGPAAIDLWLSVSAMRPTGGRAFSLTRREDHPFIVRARLAPGVSSRQAASAMDRLADDLARSHPELNAERRIAVLPVQGARVSPRADGQLVPASMFSMAFVILVLMIGTLNLANLLLVRSTARARELAVRLALGASRGRVVRLVTAEALVLSVLGGAGGLALAAAVAGAARTYRFELALPTLVDLRLDARVVGFTVVLAVATGLLFGLLPALRATRRDVNATLRDEAGSGLGTRRRVGLTGFLVGGQVAVSLLLLVVAGVFVESLVRARGVDPGLDVAGTAFVRVNAEPLGLPEEADLALMQRIEDRLEAMPGVEATATSTMLPGGQFGTTTLLLGAQVGEVDSPHEIAWNVVSIDYFDVLGIPVVDGRTFVPEDRDGPRVAVVSEAFAGRFFGRSDIAGASYRSESEPETSVEIVGVVGDVVVRSMGEEPTPSVYWFLGSASTRTNFLLAADGPTETTAANARDIIREIDPRILVLDAGSLEEHLGDTLATDRMVGGLLASLGVLALLLAMLGLYGVVSSAVSRRRREVGVRIALGAARDGVVRLFVRDVSTVVVLGLVVGLMLAIPVGGLVGRVFLGAAAGPVVTILPTAVLLAASLAATVVPALRAASTDPTHALRQE